jgi:hypothetical protein
MDRRIVNIAHRLATGVIPTRAELNYIEKAHFNRKKEIDQMPRGNQRMRAFKRWEKSGNAINKINIVRMNMNMKGRRANTQTNRSN